MKPLAIVTAENMASCRIVRPVLAALSEEISVVLIVPNLATDSGKARRRARRLLQRADLRFAAFKLVEIHVHHLLALVRGRTIRQEARRAGVRVRRFRSAQAPEFLAALREAAPRLLLSAGPAILGADVLAVPAVATLNCHGARLPDYQGAANYVWMLIEGETVAYATVQLMSLALDEGPVLAERPVPIDPTWGAYRLNYEVAGACGELYAEVASRALTEGLPAPLSRPGATARNRGLPGRRDIARLRRDGHSLVRLRDVLTCV